MSLIAEFTIQTPILQKALESVPDMVLHIEDIYMGADQPSKAILSASGGDFQTFERNIDIDPTIEEYERLTDVDDQRLYRVTHTEEVQEDVTYPVLAEHDVVILDSTGTHEGLNIRARFPGRDALIAYREGCKERDIPFELQSLYQEDKIAGDGGTINPFGLTDPQHEALVSALEMGYYSIPRDTTLEEIADELDISAQALSTRLRRGQQNLLRNALIY